jgi:superfamily I DNA/RNA helicase
MSRTWSKYQTSIFAFVETGTGNAVVEAVAGSGKSTTIVEALSRVKGSSIFLAFNRSIANELKSRGVNARTFHSLAYSIVLRHVGVRDVEQDKLRKIVDARIPDFKEKQMYGGFACKLVGLARGVGIGCLEDDTDENWYALVRHHDLELEHEDAEMSRAIEISRKLLKASNAAAHPDAKNPMVDFDDILYISVKDGLALPTFDFIFVDEAQDANPIQRAMLRKLMKKGSRMVAVGDPAQAIYGFRGADSQSLKIIQDEFQAVTLPLTVSYRCPQAVVNFAHQWVKHIEAAPGAPEGKVELLEKWDPANTFKPEDLIVCRTTAPIIGLAFSMIKRRIPARVMGREIGEQMKSLVKKMGAHDIEALLMLLGQWRDREVEKAKAKLQESLAANIQDRFEALEYLIQTLEENNRTIANLNATIDSLFADGVGKVLLSSIHKAKGLEAKRVFWLNSSDCPAKWARQPRQQEQERNLCYVAVTRAQEELYLIEQEGMVR